MSGAGAPNPYALLSGGFPSSASGGALRSSSSSSSSVTTTTAAALDEIDKDYETGVAEARRVFEETVESLRRERRDARARVMGTAGTRARHFSVGVNQYQVEHGRTACTSVALMAVVNVLCRDHNILPDDTEQAGIQDHVPWTDVVQTGVRVWTKCFQAAPSTDRRAFMSCWEVFGSDTAECRLVRTHVRVFLETHGYTNDAEVASHDARAGNKTLLDLTTNLIKPVSGCVMTCSPQQAPFAEDDYQAASRGSFLPETVTIAVFRPNNTPTLWVFDSHGSVETGDRALLCRCDTPAQAVQVIRDRFPENGRYDATHIEPDPPTAE